MRVVVADVVTAAVTVIVATTIQKLHHILKRNDIKKSDVFQSGMLEGTTPSYEASMRLKKVLASGKVVEDNE